jgi:hypothetical protein
MSTTTKPTAPIDAAIKQTKALIAELEQLRIEIEALQEQAPELVGFAEVAELLQLEGPELARRRRAGRIPAPIAELRAGPVWLKAQFTWPNTLEETA